MLSKAEQDALHRQLHPGDYPLDPPVPYQPPPLPPFSLPGAPVTPWATPATPWGPQYANGASFYRNTRHLV